MIVKQIRAEVEPGLRESFLERQRIWNQGMARAPGFVGVEVAIDPQDDACVWIFVRFESREALERFMATDHDRLAERTDMPSTYRRLEVRVLDVVERA